MKLLVFSDSHGMAALYAAKRSEKPQRRGCRHFSRPEQGQNDFQMMRALFPNIAFYSVRGNCDLGCADVPVREILDLDGAKIFCTHGHLYHVKSGLYTVVCAAREAGANLLLFGHTHEALETYDDGLYILNPGSCSGFRATCGLVDISPAGILTNILHIN